MSVHSKHGDNESIIYSRVSSLKQRDDLRCQIEELKEAYPRFRVISDIASGINFKRPGLLRYSYLDRQHEALLLTANHYTSDQTNSVIHYYNVTILP